MSKATDRKTTGEQFDSFDYCINFWEEAIDNEEDTETARREVNAARHVPAFDDVA
jgi:hypothetical protein